MYKYLLFLFLTGLGLSADAQVEIADTSGSQIDIIEEVVEQTHPDTGISIRTFSISSDSVDFLKNKKQFSYIKNLDSLLRAAQNQLEKTKPAVQSRSSFRNIFDSRVLQAVLWMIAGCFVVYIIYRLFLTKGFFDKSNKKSNVEETMTADKEFLKDDFVSLFLKAKSEGDLRSATRYLFLQTLKELETRSELEFSLDKTNSKYISELAPHKRAHFRWLVMNYEYIWYGKTMPTPERFSLIESGFNEFNRIN